MSAALPHRDFLRSHGRAPSSKIDWRAPLNASPLERSVTGLAQNPARPAPSLRQRGCNRRRRWHRPSRSPRRSRRLQEQASRAPGCVSGNANSAPLVTCVENNAVAGRGPALRHSAAPPVRVPRRGLCRPKGKSALPIQHNRRYTKCAGRKRPPTRTSYNNVMSGAPACALVRQAARLS